MASSPSSSSSSSSSARLAILRATESYCLESGVDALTLSAIASAIDEPVATITGLFHDEHALLDGVLDRHQSAYEKTWDGVLDTMISPRDVIRLLVRTLALQIEDQDGGPAYIVVASQMCTSSKFTLTGRPATTSPAALKLMGKLVTRTKLGFDVIPIRFERFAVVLFSSIAAWYRQGSSRLAMDHFIEDLVDTLEFVSMGEYRQTVPHTAANDVQR